MSRSGSVRWYGDKVYERIQKTERARMERAVRFLRNDIIRSISTKAPPASAPGEAPHLRTGELRRTITTQVIYRGTRIVGRVGTRLRYAPYLELGTSIMAARPFLVPALRRSRRTIARLLVGQKI